MSNLSTFLFHFVATDNTHSRSPKGHGGLCRYVGWINPNEIVSFAITMIAVLVICELSRFGLAVETGADSFIKILLPTLLALSLDFNIQSAIFICMDVNRLERSESMGGKILPSPKDIAAIFRVPESGDEVVPHLQTMEIPCPEIAAIFLSELDWQL